MAQVPGNRPGSRYFRASMGGVDRCHACTSALVCDICEACALHCMTPGGPDACWEAVEKYRLEHAPDRPAPDRPRWSKAN